MKRFWLTILLISLVFSACKKTGDSSQPGFEIFSSDETPQIAEIIVDANSDLKKIKLLFKENQGRVEELKVAMSAKETDKVKKIADDLVIQINEGLFLGETAITKIEKAEGMNTNETYKEYLRLKKESLRKLLDAFAFRRQAAQILHDGFGGSDPNQIGKTLALFKEKEENFQKLKDDGQNLSLEANQIAKDSTKKQ